MYEESLQLKEQLGDKQGKAASLSQMSDIFVQRGKLKEAEELLLESLELGKQIQHIDGIAFRTVKLGQISQARGDKETALARYRDGLAIFERIGMPEANQVRGMIANLESGTETDDNPIAQAITQARTSAQRGDAEAAIKYQEQAVELAREAGLEREALVMLSVVLYNLAGYYSNVERHEDAVKVLEEVVAIDEQTGHQDLESDRQTLEVAKKMASLSPEERQQLVQQAQEEQNALNEEDGFEAQLQAQLAQLPPEQRAQAEVQIRKAFEEFQRMSPDEQAAVLEQQRRAQIDNAADQVRDAGLAYARKQAPRKDVLDMLENAANQRKANEKPGSPWLEVAALCDALVALIKGEPVPPVPAAYVSHFSAVQSEIKEMK